MAELSLSWIVEDLHLQAVEHARHTQKRAAHKAALNTSIDAEDACYFLLRHAAKPSIPKPVPMRRRDAGSGTSPGKLPWSTVKAEYLTFSCEKL